ncbi:MAG: hypothetical protein OQK78_08650 [Gammaproteobacteria bacterium]|nr:hypothetical protein [Gammaproteobacteria bacterium]
MEKRVPEASALRTFFHDQWGILQNIISESRSQKIHKRRQQKRLTDAVEHIVDRVDTRIRGVSSYNKKMRSSIHEILRHIQRICMQLPAAISIKRDSYINEPLINTIFSSAQELESLLKNSDEIKACADLQQQDQKDEVYALLLVHKEEKKILGKEMRGDLIQSDVQQTAVNFYGHKIIAPATSEDEARSLLERFIFEGIASSIRSQMIQLRRQQVMQNGDQVALVPEQNMNNPETYLRVLTEQLALPKTIISLQSNQLKISKMGILLAAESSESSNDLALNELAIGRNDSLSVTLIKFRCSDWLP